MSSPLRSSGGVAPSTLRLMSDLKQMQVEPPAGVSASPVTDDNLYVWNATIFGPEESEWEGGIFSLRLTFPENYPDKAPKVRFTTDMYHPNIYSDGSLCLDIIQDKWSPIYSVSTILTSIQSLLTDPNPSSPANPEAAQLYLKDKKQYIKRVRRCAQRTVDG
eukprot:TRINITY_DN1069_c0_g1_i1.p1 TRINITY_DN1069_c0_g1~~TRINITY_DN1069_c0_g1_i1.p1  ORF type:complete len:162 (-),score=14.43 TRINITY_DN1069_c0_g1_i1:266-751(-)